MRRQGTAKGGAVHVSPELLDRYAASEAGDTAQDVWWPIESHLESCAGCRDRLGEAVARRSPATSLMLERVQDVLAAEVARSPRMPARRRWRGHRWVRWGPPTLLPRLGLTILVVLAAVGLDLADQASASRYPSLVLLVAPIVPLLAVAAAWSRGLDPAHELVLASPRAGLDLVVRRTALVLAVVIPALAVAGWLVGASPARWLLPCLAFTVGALALGEVTGLHRAASVLAVAWAAVVVGPSLVMERLPVLLATASLPGWAAATAVVAALLVLRRHAYTDLASGR